MAINFSCAPESAARLVDLALDEVETLQEAGPTLAEVRSPCKNLRSCSSQLRQHKGFMTILFISFRHTLRVTELTIWCTTDCWW